MRWASSIRKYDQAHSPGVYSTDRVIAIVWPIPISAHSRVARPMSRNAPIDDSRIRVSQPNGAFYRDVPPGRYKVTVDSYGVPYPYQFAEFDIGAGQEAFVKLLSMREKVGGEFGGGSRTRFYTWLLPPDLARPAIAGTPFYGGG